VRRQVELRQQFVDCPLHSEHALFASQHDGTPAAQFVQLLLDLHLRLLARGGDLITAAGGAGFPGGAQPSVETPGYFREVPTGLLASLPRYPA